MTHDHVCLFCLAPGAMSLKFDRRGKPFLRCFACGVRAFMPCLQALSGVAILTPYAESVVARMAADAAYAASKRHEVATLVEGLRNKLAGSLPAPVPAATTISSIPHAEGRSA
jgi:hypothetical protein